MPPTHLLLPFLRPLAPPKPSTVRTLLRFSTTTPRLLKVDQAIADKRHYQNQEEFVPEPTSTEPSTPESTSPYRGARPFTAHRTKPQIPALTDQTPYWIQRTASGNLPVYRDTKRGGNLHLVLVRKVVGNSQILAKDLRKELGLEKEYVMVERITGNLKIKCPKGADLAPQVARFLEAHKF